MTDLFDGDVFISVNGDGAEMHFKGGQPVMDKGFETHTTFAVGTFPGWWGNDIEPVASRKIESQYLVEIHKPITRQQLINTSRAAESDVAGPEFELVAAVTNNPDGDRINTEILYTPTSRDAQVLRLQKNGLNWLFQRDDPAHIQI